MFFFLSNLFLKIQYSFLTRFVVSRIEYEHVIFFLQIERRSIAIAPLFGRQPNSRIYLDQNVLCSFSAKSVVTSVIVLNSVIFGQFSVQEVVLSSKFRSYSRNIFAIWSSVIMDTFSPLCVCEVLRKTTVLPRRKTTLYFELRATYLL